MKLPFAKMQGAGNDFVVLDATSRPLELSSAQLRWLADRRFGVGADQILMVEPGQAPSGTDFTYRIFNADGGEVEQCGNGARCFVRFVHDRGLSTKTVLRVQTLRGVIAPQLLDDGMVRVDMGAPSWLPSTLPFDTLGLQSRALHEGELWPLTLSPEQQPPRDVEVAVVSMGNPHAVLRVPAAEDAEVALLGPLIEGHERFARRVNAGFMEVVGRDHIRLRVYERGAGETLACGSGACAAVVAGIRLGWLDAHVRVDTHGGQLRVEWPGPGASVQLIGPAAHVFDGVVDLPDTASLL